MVGVGHGHGLDAAGEGLVGLDHAGVRPNITPAYDRPGSHRPRAPGMITQPSGLPDRSGSATLWVVSGRGKGEQPVDVGVDDVAALRTLLRRADPSARRLAVETLEDWRGARLDAPTASAVLRAATVAYPWLSTDRTDPADRLVRLLWADPQLVPIGEIEGAYLIAGDRVRRSLLHLLALRRDQDGLRAVAFLIGTDGPVDLLPLPTTGAAGPAAGPARGGGAGARPGPGGLPAGVGLARL